ncbi:MAG: hypothetical protein WAY93_05350, partial [Atopobiaceae bacterium]
MSKKKDLENPSAAGPQTSVLGRKLLACAMSSLLVMSVPFEAGTAYAEDATATSTSGTTTSSTDTAKDEVVYAKANASGQSTGLYVVNYFNTTTATNVADPGTYTKLTNLSSSEGLTEDNGSVDLTTLANQPFYYQGDLSTSTQLPWDVQITYTLDGNVVSPDDLAGKSGSLDIELKVTGLGDDSATADFAKSFMLQAQGTFPNANFKLSDAGNATLATVGDNTLVTYLQLPGSDGDYHIKGDATDFTYSGWQISAMPINLNLDVHNYDTSQLTDATSELENGTATLADGGSSLESGLSELSDGTDAAASGAQKLADGTASAADGSATITEKLAEATTGAKSLADGLTSADTGAAKLSAALSSQILPGATSLDSGLSTAVASSKQLVQSVATLSAKESQLSSGLSTAGDGAKSLANGLDSASTGADELSSGLKTLSTELAKSEPSASALAAGIKAAGTGATKLDQGVAQLEKQLTESSGVSTSPSFYDGVVGVATGASQVSTGVAALQSKLTGTLVPGLTTIQGNLEGLSSSLTQETSDAGVASTNVKTDADKLATDASGVDALEVDALKSSASTAQGKVDAASKSLATVQGDASNAKAAADDAATQLTTSTGDVDAAIEKVNALAGVDDATKKAIVDDLNGAKGANSTAQSDVSDASAGAAGASGAVGTAQAD